MKYLVETKLISNVVLNYLFTKLLSSAEKNLFTLQSYQLKKMGLPLKITGQPYSKLTDYVTILLLKIKKQK